MKTKFESDVGLPINKTIEIPTTTIVLIKLILIS